MLREVLWHIPQDKSWEVGDLGCDLGNPSLGHPLHHHFLIPPKVGTTSLCQNTALLEEQSKNTILK